MGFLWCTIRVKNMEESLKFYREVVGLTLNNRFPAGPGMEIAFLGQGETQVELIYDPAQQGTGEFNGISLGFAVDSLEAKMEFIKEKGLAVESGPFQPGPQIKFFFVQDPNGLRIQFVEQS